MRDPKVRCVVLLVGISAVLGGCSLFKNSRTPDDNAITSAVEAKMFQDPTLKTDNIHVVSQKGVVVLSGTVGSDTEKSSAEQLAGGVSGVKQVINELTVASAAAAAPAQRPLRPSARHHGAEGGTAAGQPTETASAENGAQPAQPAASSKDAAPPAPPAPVSVTIPAGTVISVRTIDAIDSSKNRAGEEVAASIASPVTADGQVAIPQNADARLRLVSVVSAGHIKGQSEVQLELVSISANGASYPVETSVYDRKAASRGTRSAETIGGGAGLGALIGAIAGHGKGAAIGAAIGAGAGAATQEMTKAQQVVIPSETQLNFTLRSPVTVTVQP